MASGHPDEDGSGQNLGVCKPCGIQGKPEGTYPEVPKPQDINPLKNTIAELTGDELNELKLLRYNFQHQFPAPASTLRATGCRSLDP